MSDNDNLQEYRQKRDFRRTNEPEGGDASSSGDEPIFVIHKHNPTSTEPKSVLSGRTLEEIATEEGG